MSLQEGNCKAWGPWEEGPQRPAPPHRLPSIPRVQTDVEAHSGHSADEETPLSHGGTMHPQV